VTFTIRNINEHDLPEVDRLQFLAYGDDFLEDREVLLDKIYHGQESSFVLINDANPSELMGYCLSHAYPKNKVPPLNRLLLQPKVQSARHWYLHDLALVPSVRGQGTAQQLLEHLFNFISDMGCQSIGLIAVQNSVGFWQRYGFSVAEKQPDLASYGWDARYMVKEELE